MISSIQFLRGIAALLVVLLHISSKNKQYDAGVIDWLHIGNSGVDLFFIISGFIMCYTTYNKNINFSKFIILRFERILPLYWIFTLIALAIYTILPQHVNVTAQFTDVFSSFFLLPTNGEYLVLTGWTLRYEFYFYFIFSLLLFFNSKKYWQLVIAILSIPTIGLFVDKNTVWSSFLFDSLLIEFAFGIIAFYIVKSNILNKKLGYLLLTVGIISLIIGELNYTDDSKRFILYGIPMLFIFLGAVGLESVFKNKSGYFIKFIEMLGNSSYSLYITHIFVLKPVAIVCHKLGINNSFIFLSILLVASIIFGLMTYYFLEKPIANYLHKRRKTQKPKLINNNC
ncbi:hypothetical protein C6W84_17024 (plasmid) [Acinetobacter baumannii]|uniref:acyltransferase family protein n=1 Tax=Acinetobacter sp. YH12043 TaxID=2601050 RepID=UPI0011883366|nr:acyltransferase [Acinetobacter sp. YH12043]QDX16392.1 hypothetical protein C6W84_17024 [Acinetobacter baumannii]